MASPGWARLLRAPSPTAAAAGDKAPPAPPALAAGPPFRLVGVVPRAHARVIWGLAWSPDSRVLASASRDGALKLWHADRAAAPAAPAAALALGASVTSVAFAPGAAADGQYTLAAGLESGGIRIFRVPAAGGEAPPEPQEAWASGPAQQHAAAVRALCWRPARRDIGGSSGSRGLELASVGDDHAVRIFSVDLPAQAADLEES